MRARPAKCAARGGRVSLCSLRGCRACGQTTVEYAILAFVTVSTVVAAVLTVRSAVIDFYYDVVSVICLPFP